MENDDSQKIVDVYQFHSSSIDSEDIQNQKGKKKQLNETTSLRKICDEDLQQNRKVHRVAYKSDKSEQEIKNLFKQQGIIVLNTRSHKSDSNKKLCSLECGTRVKRVSKVKAKASMSLMIPGEFHPQQFKTNEQYKENSSVSSSDNYNGGDHWQNQNHVTVVNNINVGTNEEGKLFDLQKLFDENIYLQAELQKKNDKQINMLQDKLIQKQHQYSQQMSEYLKNEQFMKAELENANKQIQQFENELEQSKQTGVNQEKQFQSIANGLNETILQLSSDKNMEENSSQQIKNIIQVHSIQIKQLNRSLGQQIDKIKQGFQQELDQQKIQVENLNGIHSIQMQQLNESFDSQIQTVEQNTQQEVIQIKQKMQNEFEQKICDLKIQEAKKTFLMQQKIDGLSTNIEELKKRTITDHIPNIPIFIQGIDQYYNQKFTMSKLENSLCVHSDNQNTFDAISQIIKAHPKQPTPFRNSSVDNGGQSPQNRQYAD